MSPTSIRMRLLSEVRQLVVEAVARWCAIWRAATLTIPPAFTGFPVIHCRIQLPFSGFLQVCIDPIASLLLQPLDQRQALDRNLRDDVFRRTLVRGLEDQAIDEFVVGAHAASFSSWGEYFATMASSSPLKSATA